ncbi:MAG: hypothetical protein HZB31_06235 [Nitrospirae bacterium]|nr:hypothetical protein [Nitrospirota bacterium]
MPIWNSGFFGDGKLRIFSFSQEKEHGEQTLKIRRNEPGFPVEWEHKTGKKEIYYSKSVGRYRAFGRFGNNIRGGLLMSYIGEDPLYIFRPARNDKAKYEIVKVGKKPLGIKNYDLPDFYIGRTRSKDVEEYFGYRFVKAYDGDNMPIISGLELKKDMSGFIQRDIQFATHTKNLGVGYFDVKDIDGDGIDEIILVEENGEREYFEDGDVFFYSDVKDYIKILKWTGKKYEVMWESPPYNKRGTKVLIDDVKGTGKKQLVVLTREGTVQIWEKK